MPNTRKDVRAANSIFSPVFRFVVDKTKEILLDVSGLTDDEVDEKGYVKPGVPLTAGGVLVGVGAKVEGVTIEPIKIPTADDNVAGTLAAATDFLIIVGTHNTVNRDVAEDYLGRAYTADEIAGFAGSTLILTDT